MRNLKDYPFNDDQRKQLSNICASLGKTSLIAAFGAAFIHLDPPVNPVIIMLAAFVGGSLIGLSIKLLRTNDRKHT